MSKQGGVAASKRSAEEIPDNGEGDDSQEVPAKKANKAKGKKKEEEIDDVEDIDDEEDDDLEDEEDELGEEEEDEEDEDDEEDDGQPKKPFTPKSFVILKTDYDDKKDDAPIWKIDGCSLLQKYVPDKEKGKSLYKSTSVYSGWSIKNKDKYYAAPVEYKEKDCGDSIVELKSSELKKLNEGKD